MFAEGIVNVAVAAAASVLAMCYSCNDVQRRKRQLAHGNFLFPMAKSIEILDVIPIIGSSSP